MMYGYLVFNALRRPENGRFNLLGAKIEAFSRGGNEPFPSSTPLPRTAAPDPQLSAPPFAPPGTQQSKMRRCLQRLAPSSQKCAAVCNAWHPAVKNAPPFAPLGAQQSKMRRRFHNFWPSGQKRAVVFTNFRPAVKNTLMFSQLLAQRSKHH